jgi:hypothetical protein
MSLGEVHVNDVGTSFQATVKDETGKIVDVSGASTLQISFKRPDGTKLGPKTASMVNDGKDGLIQYTTVSGDINKAGNWKVQGFVRVSGGEYYSDIYDFIVYGNL